MNMKVVPGLTLAAALVLPMTFTTAMAHGVGYGKGYGKSCGYSGWQHPYGYGMGGWKHPGGYGYGYKKHGYGHGMYGHGKSYGHGKGYGHGMGHGKSYGHGKGYGHHPHGHGMYHGKGYYGHGSMMDTGRYGGGYKSEPTASSESGMSGKGAVGGKDIVDTAIAAGTFTTLVEAVKAAGLVDTLRSDGPFTVFAPTDEAFSKIPQEQLNALLQDKDKLTAVLTYHVAPGKLPAKDVVASKKVKTVQGQSLTVRAGDEGVRIDDAKVTKADIIASNGVIHVIDTVVIPN